MPRKKGDIPFTDRERYFIKSTIKDLITFGANEKESLDTLEKKLGHTVHERTYYLFKKEIEKEEGSADEWISNFARFGIASHFKRRVDEVEYIQRTMMLLYAQELDKDKKNVYAINLLARTIVETSKVLAEYGIAPPIIAKIKSMIPLEISSINKKLEDTQNNLKATNTYMQSLGILKEEEDVTPTNNKNNGQDRSKPVRLKAETPDLPTDSQAISGRHSQITDDTAEQDDNRVF